MLSLHEPEIDHEDEQAVLETLRSTWISTGGIAVDTFEKEIAEFTGAQFAVSVSNGTVGLQLMLLHERLRRGLKGPFEVIIPSLTFIATANSVIHAGGVPRFIDIAANSLNFSLESLAATLDQYYEYKPGSGGWYSKDYKLPLLAFMPVHIMGWCGDLMQLAAFCQERQITILEDAAESLGTRLPNGLHTGLIGSAGALSFNGNKILTTGGGGMILTNDAAAAKRMKHLSTTAKTDGLRFTHDEVGYNFRLVGILAALGSSQLRKLPARIKAKAAIHEYYEQSLAGYCRIHQEIGCQPNYWLANAVFDTMDEREAALSNLIEGGVQARPLWTPIHLQPAYQTSKIDHLPLAETERAWQRTLSLPSSPQLQASDLKLVSDLIKQAMKHGGVK